MEMTATYAEGWRHTRRRSGSSLLWPGASEPEEQQLANEPRALSALRGACCGTPRVPGDRHAVGVQRQCDGEARHEPPERGLRLGDGGGPGEPQLRHEAALEGTRDALHAALGQRGAGEAKADR